MGYTCHHYPMTRHFPISYQRVHISPYSLRFQLYSHKLPSIPSNLINFSIFPNHVHISQCSQNFYLSPYSVKTTHFPLFPKTVISTYFLRLLFPRILTKVILFTPIDHQVTWFPVSIFNNHYTFMSFNFVTPELLHTSVTNHFELYLIFFSFQLFKKKCIMHFYLAIMFYLSLSFFTSLRSLYLFPKHATIYSVFFNFLWTHHFSNQINIFQCKDSGDKDPVKIKVP